MFCWKDFSDFYVSVMVIFRNSNVKWCAPRDFSTVSLLQIKPHVENIIWKKVLFHFNPFESFASEAVHTFQAVVLLLFLQYVVRSNRAFGSLMEIRSEILTCIWVEKNCWKKCTCQIPLAEYSPNRAATFSTQYEI